MFGGGQEDGMEGEEGGKVGRVEVEGTEVVKWCETEEQRAKREEIQGTYVEATQA